MGFPHVYTTSLESLGCPFKSIRCLPGLAAVTGVCLGGFLMVALLGTNISILKGTFEDDFH